MADHSKPTVTSTYANYTSELDGRLDDLALGLDPATTSPTNVPTNAIRWASASNKWQKWNGSSWVDLSGSYSININGTVGATTPAAGSFTNASYTGTLTGGTGVVNIGSGQVYKDASGNVGIGTSSPVYPLAVSGVASVQVQIRAGNTSDSVLLFGDTDSAAVGRITYAHTDDGMRFTTNGSERARIDSSGNLLVGVTAVVTDSTNVVNGGVSISGDGELRASKNDARAAMFKRTTSVGTVVDFYKDSSLTGSISVTATTTAYNTSSDYRLKEDWVAVADASTRVTSLKPVNFSSKVDGSRVDGFLAHELAEVVPEAVTGAKDAVDADGKPVYQVVDQSKLVPLLTAALQEALAKIESLEARLDAANL